MSRKLFYLSKHKDIWYARIIDQKTGKELSARSTGQTNRDLAVMTVSSWLANGIPETKNTPKRELFEAISVSRLFDAIEATDLTVNEGQKIISLLKKKGILDKPKKADAQDFIAFLLNFYDYEKSPYVRDKLAHGQSIGRTHCNDSLLRIKKYWAKAFKNRTLSSITREDLRNFSLSLVDRKLTPNTINKIMIAGKVALSWAHREGYIITNPSEKLTTFIGHSKERGILTDEETRELFEQHWNEERGYIGNLVAATCGLRAGEVLALRKEDIGVDRLFIRHAWSSLDGLKSPKNGDQRQVPLLPELREKLIMLADKNPWEDGFIFYSTKENQPMDQKFLVNGLYDALKKIGIDEERKTRNIVFHSWRHRYATKMADLVDSRSLGLATGHKTQAMLEHYANHANENHFIIVKNATQEAFGETNNIRNIN